MWVNGWMNVLRTLMRCRRTCRRVMKADICTHESSGCRPGTGQRLQQPDLAEDAGCWNRESIVTCDRINLISLVLERADGVYCMYCIWNGLYRAPWLYVLPFVPAVKTNPQNLRCHFKRISAMWSGVFCLIVSVLWIWSEQVFFFKTRMLGWNKQK